MDSLHFDCYSSSDSAPRTPSPQMVHFQYKHDLHDNVVHNIFANEDDWHHNSFPPSRGSLLQELYEPDINDSNAQQVYPYSAPENWHHIPSSPRPQEYHMIRRATFPYVRHDRDDPIPIQQYSPFMQQQQQQQQHQHHQHHHSVYPHDHLDSANLHVPSMSDSPHSSYNEFDDPSSIKLEDNTAPIIVPSQSSFYPSAPGCHPLGLTYLPQSGLPVQHTDDAASKETQYLRRRCFNCHTTEPPSWRRSTLNPGKIVCNKCGLYERTHLRPRPLRFDELRAGNKARKQSQTASTGLSGKVSPKQKVALVKKEPREYAVNGTRRSSVSSASSVHSGSGASDWDDNVSVYSAGSAPPTSFNSPNVQTFPLSRDASQSPPSDGGIRLPNAPLSDIASLQQQQQQQQQQQPLQSPRKAHTSPPGYFSAPAQEEFFRRNSQDWGVGVGMNGAMGMGGMNSGSDLMQSPLPTPVAS